MTISENNNKLIKDWIRPLQKSLTIETENKFINTLGRKKYWTAVNDAKNASRGAACALPSFRGSSTCVTTHGS